MAVLLSIEVVTDAPFLESDVVAFLREGPFRLCFEGRRRIVRLRDVVVRLPAALLLERHQVWVALGWEELGRLVLGPAWLEKV